MRKSQRVDIGGNVNIFKACRPLFSHFLVGWNNDFSCCQRFLCMFELINSMNFQLLLYVGFLLTSQMPGYGIHPLVPPFWALEPRRYDPLSARFVRMAAPTMSLHRPWLTGWTERHLRPPFLWWLDKASLQHALNIAVHGNGFVVGDVCFPIRQDYLISGLQ